MSRLLDLIRWFFRPGKVRIPPKQHPFPYVMKEDGTPGRLGDGPWGRIS